MTTHPATRQQAGALLVAVLSSVAAHQRPRQRRRVSAERCRVVSYATAYRAEHCAWPSSGQVQTAIGIHERTARRALAALRETLLMPT